MDGQTETPDEQIVAFRKFADAPEIRTFSQFRYVNLCTRQQHHENSFVHHDTIQNLRIVHVGFVAFKVKLG
jgi:hypothetical protein